MIYCFDILLTYILVYVSYTGTVQIHLRYARGIRRVRSVLVPGGGTVATLEAEERKEPHNQDKRVSTGIPADLQTDAALHDRRLRRWTQSRQQGEEQRRPSSST